MHECLKMMIELIRTPFTLNKFVQKVLDEQI